MHQLICGKEVVLKRNNTGNLKYTTSCGEGEHKTIQDEVYKKHLNYRQIILNGPIESSIIERVVMQIEAYNHEDDEREERENGYSRLDNPITIYINSYGGYVYDGLAAVSAIQQSHTPVITVAQGKAMSMGFMILIAGHIRYAYRHATIMHHQISSGAFGTLQGMIDEVDHCTALQKRCYDIIMSKTKITKEKLDDIQKRKFNWCMFPEEALEHGVIDGIVAEGVKLVIKEDGEKEAAPMKKAKAAPKKPTKKPKQQPTG